MDPDELTWLLIAQLHLQDVEAMNNSRKGKGREGSRLSDEEYAIQVQAELLNGFLGIMEDRRIAESLSNAMESDLYIVEQLVTKEQAAQDDHRYAAALAQGQPLPEKSDAQRRVEVQQAADKQRSGYVPLVLYPTKPRIFRNNLRADNPNASASGSSSGQGSSKRSVVYKPRLFAV